ncbi:unnamed protein product [Rotaria sp. Silwood1]|nr:unnamed protein product [Rotaria sp. Silwood1]
MAELIKVFFIGGTGYIGGSVLARLLPRQGKDLDITVLTRSQDKAKLFEKMGVKTVVASLDDVDILSKVASESNVVFHTADADHIESAQAIIEGLKKKKQATGKAQIYIHTSGTGVLGDDARGEYTTDKIYSDLNIPLIESIPRDAVHREIDLAIVAAGESGDVKTYIILPSTIYGIAKNELTAAGIQNPHSIQIPQLIRASLDRKQAGIVGKGVNQWPNVHIDDVADLYIVVLDAALAGTAAHGREGFYFAENGEHVFLDIANEVARVLHERGIGTDKPSLFSDEEAKKYFGSYYLGSNSRARSERGRLFGLSPKYTTKDFIASIPAEIDAIINRDGGKPFVVRVDGPAARRK